MVWLVFVALVAVLALLRYPALRLAVFHAAASVWYAVRDAYTYVRRRRWREAPTGRMVCYAGLFGRGKTLSAVHELVRLYRRYDGLRVWDDRSGRYVLQKVRILSNVRLTAVPYSHLRGLSDIVSEAENTSALDAEMGVRSVILVLIDEASVQLNSRSFKGNISPAFLNTMLTCRHYHMSIFYTSQRYNLTDKLLRDVTQQVIDCRKLWRYQVQYIYDAWALENAYDPTAVRPIGRGGWFVRDADYSAYDTLAVVDQLAKSCAAGDMLSDDEILRRRADTYRAAGLSRAMQRQRKHLLKA